METRQRIDVAVAVVQNDQGQVLWARRPEGKPYAAYWEFPGGKVEASETIWQALVRELQEELGIVALEGGPWFVVDHDYEHAHVRLHLYRVWRFSGRLQALENQVFTWDTLQPEGLSPILPATLPLLPVLNQAPCMALTHYQSGFEAYSRRLEKALQAQGPRWSVQFREKNMSDTHILAAYKHCKTLCLSRGVSLVINSDCHAQLKRLGQVDPTDFVHLTEAHLLDEPRWVGQAIGASVHSAQSLAKAHALGLKYAVLGSVRASPTHPGQSGMGWEGFEHCVAACRLPVYAIGGLGVGDLQEAMRHGAHGVATIRNL